jgi:hypothetical protein
MTNSDAITVCGADESNHFQPFSAFFPLLSLHLLLFCREKKKIGWLVCGHIVLVSAYFLISLDSLLKHIVQMG